MFVTFAFTFLTMKDDGRSVTYATWWLKKHRIS